jgi:hypothetical protein
VLPLDLDAPERMAEAFRQVSMTRRVPPEEAQRYGLYDPDDPELADALGDDGLVEISQWRHAIINLPHPLLKQGLVILDTPGLNAIGTEPELTLNLIPNAHAVLFVLAAETGVTKQRHRGLAHPYRRRGRAASSSSTRSTRCGTPCAATPRTKPRSRASSTAWRSSSGSRRARCIRCRRRRRWSARIQGDMALFERSRLGATGSGPAARPDPAKARRSSAASCARTWRRWRAAASALAARARGLVEQLQELKSLRGKNQNVLAHMMRRIEAERKDFDAGLLRLQDARPVRHPVDRTVFDARHGRRCAPGRRGARGDAGLRFATGMRAPVRAFFENVRASIDAAERQVTEIGAMMEAMVRGFAAEHGLTLAPPMPLSLARYRDEIDAVEALYANSSAPRPCS